MDRFQSSPLMSMPWKILKSLSHWIDINIVFAQNSLCTFPQAPACGSILFEDILIFALGRNINCS